LFGLLWWVRRGGVSFRDGGEDGDRTAALWAAPVPFILGFRGRGKGYGRHGLGMLG